MRFSLLTLFISVLLLSGCGKKGPLYLPEEEPEQQAQTAPEAATQLPRLDTQELS